jgi:hypothetical protein
MDQQYHRALQQILEKLDGLDKKIDRHIAYLISYLNAESAPPQDTVPGDKKDFEITVDEKGVFSYQPSLPWQYRPGDQIRWLSKSGRLTVLIDGYPEFSSPFDDPTGRTGEPSASPEQNEIEGRRFEAAQEDGKQIWSTRRVRVQSVFSEQERQIRRRVHTRPLLYDFTFEIRTGEELFVETVRNVGSMC